MSSLAAMSESLCFFRFFLFPIQLNYLVKMKVLASETICPFSSQWLSKAFKFVQKLGRELTFCGALEDTSTRHAARLKSPRKNMKNMSYIQSTAMNFYID